MAQSKNTLSTSKQLGKHRKRIHTLRNCYKNMYMSAFCVFEKKPSGNMPLKTALNRNPYFGK